MLDDYPFKYVNCPGRLETPDGTRIIFHLGKFQVSIDRGFPIPNEQRAEGSKRAYVKNILLKKLEDSNAFRLEYLTYQSHLGSHPFTITPTHDIFYSLAQSLQFKIMLEFATEHIHSRFCNRNDYKKTIYRIEIDGTSRFFKVQLDEKQDCFVSQEISSQIEQ